MKATTNSLILLPLIALILTASCPNTVINQDNDPPSIVILEPADGTAMLEGDLWDFTGTVGDDKTTADLRITLGAPNTPDGIIQEGIIPDGAFWSVMGVSLQPGTDKVIEASVVDKSGEKGTDTVTIHVLPEGSNPVCDIIEPSIGPALPNFPNFDIGELIFFEGHIVENETACEGIAYEWTSNLETAELNSGLTGGSTPDCFTSFSIDTLMAGDHMITLTVTDGDGLSGACNLAVTLHDPLTFDHDGDCYCEVGPCTASADASCLSILEGDCNDDEAGVNPGQIDEICDGFDTDCDGFMPPEEVDDGDLDGSPTCLDCDDTDNTVYPGAPDICDGLDNDCNSNTADGSNEPWFQQSCGSNVGQCSVGMFLCQGAQQSCAGEIPPVTEDLTNPSVMCDGLDNDCDSLVDLDDIPAPDRDGDGDGANFCVDCDDGNSSLNLIDIDGDGFASCDGDCNDLDPNINPAAAEVCNGVDDDCNGLQDAGNPGFPQQETDTDGDGLSTCAGDCDDSDPTMNQLDSDSDGFSTCNGDCNDLSASSFPGAPELCDGLDNDCNGMDDVLGFDRSETDDDGDGQTECGGDCDDLNASRYSGSPEICDGIDNNCNGLDDAGNPGVGGQEVDNDGDFQSECQGDCDDTNPNRRTGQAEVCDGIDNDCNGLDDAGNPGVGGQEADNDGDGQSECQGDCDDTNPGNFTGNTEVCDGFDNDCNGQDDFLGFNGSETDNDGDILSECQGDCNDSNSSIFLGAPESCDGVDSDCDGNLDNGGPALCPAPPNVNTTVCGGASGCAIASCTANNYDTDGAYANGCNCADAVITANCAGAASLGSISTGGLTATPVGSIPSDVFGTAPADWYVVSFPAASRPGSGKPTILMTRNDGGDYLFDILPGCASSAVCGGAVQWDLSDNADSTGTYGVNSTAWPSTVYVKVYRVSNNQRCGKYQITVSR